MSSPDLVQLHLATQEVTVPLHFPPEKGLREHAIDAQFEIVNTIAAPDGQEIHNPDHFANPERTIFSAKTGEESITLPTHKAERLVSFFRSLTPGHSFQCHDFVGAVVGWKEDSGLGTGYEHNGTKYRQGVVSGHAYSLFIPVAGPTPGKEYYRRPHSCLGTDSQRFLGLVGEGLMLGVMDPETTRRIYSRGHPSGFTETIDLTEQST